MSSAVFANLPRFDTSAPPVCEPEPEIEETPPAPPPIDMSAVNAAVAALESAVRQVEDNVRTQVVEGVQAMAGKLFPALSEQFLSEEIGRHLPALVPASAPRVEICAEPELSDRIGAVVERAGALAERCVFSPMNSAEDCRVHVSWETGGVTFDFDGLLEACMARLGAPSVEEGS